MYNLIIKRLAQKSLDFLKKKDKNTLNKIVTSLDQLQELGTSHPQVRQIVGRAPTIYRIRV